MVCILDGYGYNTEDKWNGVHMAETPVYDRLRKDEARFRSVLVNHVTVLQDLNLDRSGDQPKDQASQHLKIAAYVGCLATIPPAHVTCRLTTPSLNMTTHVRLPKDLKLWD